jgi:hypothetical protein
MAVQRHGVDGAAVASIASDSAKAACLSSCLELHFVFAVAGCYFGNPLFAIAGEIGDQGRRQSLVERVRRRRLLA